MNQSGENNGGRFGDPEVDIVSTEWTVPWHCIPNLASWLGSSPR
jgi:hypothetical protein